MKIINNFNSKEIVEFGKKLQPYEKFFTNMRNIKNAFTIYINYNLTTLKLA